MKGIIITNSNGDYCGITQINSLAEYMDDRKLGGDIESFMGRYVDEETQLIEYSPYSLYDAKELCKKISKRFEECRIVVFSDEEQISDESLEFIGYDICASDYYTSPLGLEYLHLTAEDAEFYDDPEFYENLDNDVILHYLSKQNEYRLYDEESRDIADEIAEYCNWLCDEYDGVFEGESDFRVIRIYKVM